MTALTPPTMLLVGDARTELATLPPACVQTVCTSPPYFGLRDYGSAPQVWDGNQACAHTWELHPRYNPTKHANAASFGKQAYLPEEHSPRTCGALCGRCKAWCGSLGQEPTLDLYVAHLVDVFRAVRRVLRDDGTLWLNLGDSYSRNGGTGGHGPNAQVGATRSLTQRRQTHAPEELGEKQLLMVPARVALALQADGWLLRADIIWHKPNAMPESVTDRPTTAHEHIFLLAKQPRYFYDAAAILEPANLANKGNRKTFRGGGVYTGGASFFNHTPKANNSEGNTLDASGMRNSRSVWTVATAPYPEAHFATWPEALVRPMVLAGSRPGDWVLDPFAGSGTTLAVARSLGRNAVGVELQADYLPLITARLAAVTPWWETVAPMADEDFGPLFAAVAV